MASVRQLECVASASAPGSRLPHRRGWYASAPVRRKPKSRSGHWPRSSGPADSRYSRSSEPRPQRRRASISRHLISFLPPDALRPGSRFFRSLGNAAHRRFQIRQSLIEYCLTYRLLPKLSSAERAKSEMFRAPRSTHAFLRLAYSSCVRRKTTIDFRRFRAGTGQSRRTRAAEIALCRP